jgi:hypothetical protein
MISNIIFLFGLSFVFQILLSIYIYKNVFNPIFYFNVLFFLHNWAFSFGTYLYPDAYFIWRADPSVSYDTQGAVLVINLVSLWAFFLTFIFFSKKKSPTKIGYSRLRNLSLFPFIYFLLTGLLIAKLISDGAFIQVYGQGQALTSETSFTPALQLLNLRFVFASAYLILNRNKNKKIIVFMFMLEILFTLVDGGRKALVIMLLSLLLSHLESHRVNFIKAFKIIGAGILVLYILLLTIFYRGTDRDESMMYRFSDASDVMAESSSILTFLAINMASSEGVQNWTYQLIEDGTMEKSYGRSYAQAILNIFILRPFQGDIADWQAAYHFKYVAYPSVSNHGYDFSFTAESILNWGWQFSFLSYCFLAVVVSFIQNRKTMNDFWCLMYFALWPILFLGFRSDSTSILRMLSFYVFVALIGSIDFKRLKLGFIKKEDLK